MRRVELEGYVDEDQGDFADDDALSEVMSVDSLESVRLVHLPNPRNGDPGPGGDADKQSTVSHRSRSVVSTSFKKTQFQPERGRRKRKKKTAKKKVQDEVPEDVTAMPRRAKIALAVGLTLMVGAAVLLFHQWEPSNNEDDDWSPSTTPGVAIPTRKPTSYFGRDPMPTLTPAPRDGSNGPGGGRNVPSPTLSPVPITPISPGDTVVDVYGSLYVKGRYLYSNKTKAPVQLAGMSFFWSNTGWGGEKYYSRAVVETLTKEWNCSIIRAAMGVEDDGGYVFDPTGNKERVQILVDAAIEFGIYVIIDFHSHYAENYEPEARNFFGEMAQLYGNEPNVIFEIYNEPILSSWENDIKPYAETILGLIRLSSPNLVVVGTADWSQKVDDPAADPIVGENVAYTLHFYAATHEQWLRDRVAAALDDGICIFATEWGTIEADGDGLVDSVNTALWIDFLNEHKISHLNWALNDKDEGASALREGATTTAEWTSADYTPSGRLVRSILRDAAAARHEHLFIEMPPSQMPVRDGSPLQGNVVDTHGALAAESSTATIIGGISRELFQLRGMSLYSTSSGGEFYNRGVIDELVDDWNVNVVRASMAVESTGGYLEDQSTNEARLREIVESAIARGIYVIVDWHTERAEDYLSQAESFFESIASEYGEHPNVVFEIGVPSGSEWSTDAKPYAEAVLATIRQHSSNLVLIGTPDDNQDVDDASLDPVIDSNVAYTLRFYAGTHTRVYRDKAFFAMANNAALVATQYGTSDSLGKSSVDRVSTLEWLEFLDRYGIGHCNWALNDDDDSTFSALLSGSNLDGGWTLDDLTPSGKLARSILLNYTST